MNNNTSYYLEHIDSDSEEFKKVIADSGIPYNPDNITPIILERIVNRKLQDRFQKHLEYVCKRRNMTKEEAVIYPTYHGTTEDALNNILENGFDVAYNRVAMYGIGTYSATNYVDAMNYSKLDRTGHQFLLVCKVVKGKTKVGSINEILDKDKYDSFTNNASYYSCPYNEGIIPVYVIRYYQHIPLKNDALLHRRMPTITSTGDQQYVPYTVADTKPKKVIHRFR